MDTFHLMICEKNNILISQNFGMDYSKFLLYDIKLKKKNNTSINTPTLSTEDLNIRITKLLAYRIWKRISYS